MALETDPMASILVNDPSSLASLLVQLKSMNKPHQPLYLPGTGSASDLEALFYLGVEVFDTIKAREDGLKGRYYTHNSELSFRELRSIGGPSELCSCRVCSGQTDKEFIPIHAAEHNVEMISRRLMMARHHLSRGTLRQHIMGILAGKPEQMSLVRMVEKGAGWPLMGSTWTYRKNDNVPVTYRDDLVSPDFRLWRERIKNDFIPLEHKTVLLLLPCSHRKPYSASRTHKRIDNLLNSVKGWKVHCQRLVITSPLGAVPMELEDLYPASHYDIPVTGEWFLEEKILIRELTTSVLSKGGFQSIICFHREGSEFFEEEISSRKMDGVEFIDIHSRPDSKDTPPERRLREVIGSELEDLGNVPDRRKNEIMEVLKSVEFSLGIRLDHTGDMKLIRNRRGTFLRSGKSVLFELRKGGPVPTLELGKRMWEEEGQGRRAYIDDFTPKGTLFSQGINSTEGDIRPGDIVLIGHGKSFRAIGRSQIPGYLMGSENRGDGIRIMSYVR
jgi:archaeosine synthase